jgi:hypothetical protein
MQHSKQRALMFLLGAVLVSGAVGFSADRMIVRDRLCPQVGSATSYRQRFAEELGLTAAQKAAVDSILDARHAAISEVLKPVRPQLDAISESASVRIRSHLTAGQNQKFDEWRRELKQRQQEQHKGADSARAEKEKESGGSRL